MKNLSCGGDVRVNSGVISFGIIGVSIGDIDMGVAAGGKLHPSGGEQFRNGDAPAYLGDGVIVPKEMFPSKTKRLRL